MTKNACVAHIYVIDNCHCFQTSLWKGLFTISLKQRWGTCSQWSTCDLHHHLVLPTSEYLLPKINTTSHENISLRQAENSEKSILLVVAFYCYFLQKIRVTF